MSQHNDASVRVPAPPLQKEANRTSPQRPAGNSSINIVIFGESGVGKSSLINLIAGKSVAATSNAIKGCTSEHHRHEFEVNETRYTFWDTVGLDEGTCGTVPAKKAKAKLRQLLRMVTKANGVHLLIYCVRASRAKKALLHNYNFFYSTICQKKVPIVLVATGLEEHSGEMEEWWATNEAEFAKLGMHFDGHACVTTLVPQSDDSSTVKQRSVESRQSILLMIASTCSRSNNAAEQRSWKSVALNAVRAMIRPTHSQPTPILTRDATTDGGAREWWNNSIDPAGKVRTTVRALPQAGSAELEVAVERIRKTIPTRELQPDEGAPGGCFAWLRGMKRLPSGHLSAGVQDDALVRAKVWALRKSV